MHLANLFVVSMHIISKEQIHNATVYNNSVPYSPHWASKIWWCKLKQNYRLCYNPSHRRLCLSLWTQRDLERNEMWSFVDSTSCFMMTNRWFTPDPRETARKSSESRLTLLICDQRKIFKGIRMYYAHVFPNLFDFCVTQIERVFWWML